MEQAWTFGMEYEGKPCGTGRARREGLYMIVDCDSEPVTGEVVRAYLPTAGEPCCLGVLVPEGGRLRLTRRIPTSRFPQPPFETAVISKDGELWAPWSGEVDGVAVEGALSKREGGARVIALPWSPDAPFPWMALALRCTPRRIGEEQYLTLRI